MTSVPGSCSADPSLVPDGSPSFHGRSHIGLSVWRPVDGLDTLEFLLRGWRGGRLGCCAWQQKDIWLLV